VKRITTTTGSTAAALGSQFPRTRGRPRRHSTATATAVAITTTAPTTASGISELLMWARYGLLSTSPSTAPQSAPASRPMSSGAACRRRDSSRIPQYGITGRMSLAPSMRTSSVGRAPAAERGDHPCATALERVDDQAQPPRNRICASGSL
jgi:hypothetical protein